ATSRKHGHFGCHLRIRIDNISRPEPRRGEFPQAELDRLDNHVACRPPEPARKMIRVVPFKHRLLTAKIAQQLQVRLLDDVLHPSLMVRSGMKGPDCRSHDLAL